MLLRMWRKGNPLTLLVGMQADAATLENSMEVPQKIKIELPYDPAIAQLGIYPKDTNIVIQRVMCTPIFIATTSCPQQPNYGKSPDVHRHVNGPEDVTHTHTHTHTHTEILCSHQKKKSCGR